jgi:aminopeptidase-like protein
MTVAMTLPSSNTAFNSSDPGRQMQSFVAELYPICRSITGDGLRETLRRIAQRIPLKIHEVPSGTRVLDWTVPKEWNIREAWVKDSSGRRVIDFAVCNLHVVNYSVPVRRSMSLAELRPHLYTLPDRPDLIPYRTSYYDESWGFCLEHRVLEALPEDDYEVYIDSTLRDGHLSYGELLLPGTRAEEVLISCHVCHPSLCNDNLSGIAVAVALAQQLLDVPRRLTYRFLFVPGTIGAITWLALHEDEARYIRHGLVLAGVGDAAPLSYKKSRQGSAEIDRVMELVLRESAKPFVITEFSPYGYDERQYCSPGFNLAVGRLSRSAHGEFPEYHTSGDNLNFVRTASLDASLRVCSEAFRVLEDNRTYSNLNPKGEPQLGKRGLYRAIGGNDEPAKIELAMLWTLNLSDGRHSLLEIATRSGIAFSAIAEAARLLSKHGLLREEIDASDSRVISASREEF